MRDFIQKVIATEAEAKQMVAAAGSEAERILSETQKRAQELTATARSAFQFEAKFLLAAGAAKAAQEKSARQALTAAEIGEKNLDEPARRQAVAAVVRCVCGIDQTV